MIFHYNSLICKHKNTLQPSHSLTQEYYRCNLLLKNTERSFLLDLLNHYRGLYSMRRLLKEYFPYNYLSMHIHVFAQYHLLHRVLGSKGLLRNNQDGRRETIGTI